MQFGPYFCTRRALNFDLNLSMLSHEQHQVRNPTLDEAWMVAMAGPANRQGRMVADNISGKNRAFRGTIGTSVLRCFDLTCACTGVNERMVKGKGMSYKVAPLSCGMWHVSRVAFTHTVSCLRCPCRTSTISKYFA